MNGAEAMTLAAALIGAAGGLWAVAATLKGNRQLLAVKHQVENDHGDEPPLRVDLDQKFASIHTAIEVEAAKRSEQSRTIFRRLESIEEHLRAK